MSAGQHFFLDPRLVFQAHVAVSRTRFLAVMWQVPHFLLASHFAISGLEYARLLVSSSSFAWESILMRVSVSPFHMILLVKVTMTSVVLNLTDHFQLLHCFMRQVKAVEMCCLSSYCSLGGQRSEVRALAELPFPRAMGRTLHCLFQLPVAPGTLQCSLTWSPLISAFVFTGPPFLCVYDQISIFLKCMAPVHSLYREWSMIAVLLVSNEWVVMHITSKSTRRNSKQQSHQVRHLELNEQRN